MTVSLVQVPNKLIARIWPQAVPWLEKGREYWEDFYDLDDFLRLCIKGDLQLWVYIKDKKVKGVLISALIVYPKAVYLRYLYAGAEDLRVWQNYAYLVENWAKSHGATGWEVLGRNWGPVVTKKFDSSQGLKKGHYFFGKFGD